MPTRNKSWKPEHSFQNPNKKRKKSWKKYQKVMKRYASLKKREEKEGKTKWIEKTMEKCMARIKKYGITPAMLEASVKAK